MSTEAELREKIATLTSIFAMRGLLGIHGHISAYDPDADLMYICPGFGWDKANTRPEDADARLSDRARLAWSYFAQQEARWDRQPPIGGSPLG